MSILSFALSLATKEACKEAAMADSLNRVMIDRFASLANAADELGGSDPKPGTSEYVIRENAKLAAKYGPGWNHRE